MKDFHLVRGRKGNVLHLSGITYGVPVKVLAENDAGYVLHTRSSTQWSGIGHTATAPALYMLARKVDGGFDVIEEVQPCYRWKAARTDLLEKLAALT